MNDWLDKLKQAAAGRTKGKWSVAIDNEGDAVSVWSTENTGCDADDDTYNTVCKMPVEKYDYGCAWDSKGNADFISTFANCADELLAVVEAAKLLAGKTSGWREMVRHKLPEDWVAGMELIDSALAALERKVGGECSEHDVDSVKGSGSTVKPEDFQVTDDYIDKMQRGEHDEETQD